MDEGIPGSGNEPAERPVGERANPATCLHRVIEGCERYGGYVEYECVSCDTDIPAEHWEGRLYKYLPEYHRWEQVGPSPRKKRIVDELADFNFNEYSARDEEGRWWLIGGPNGPVRHPDDPDVPDGGVERPQTSGSSDD